MSLQRPSEPASGPADEHAFERRDERVPLFGSWRKIHLAVAASAIVVMLLLALFSRWPF